MILHNDLISITSLNYARGLAVASDCDTQLNSLSKILDPLL